MDEEFRAWLIRKASQRPTRPAFTEQWLQKQAQNAANQREFQQYQASRARVSLPPPHECKKNQNDPQAKERAKQRLQTLRRMWSEGDRVRQQLADNPEWQLEIGDRGTEEVKRD